MILSGNALQLSGPARVHKFVRGVASALDVGQDDHTQPNAKFQFRMNNCKFKKQFIYENFDTKFIQKRNCFESKIVVDFLIFLLTQNWRCTSGWRGSLHRLCT